MGESNLALPCGQCIGCRAARATAWANRCGHEASQWNDNTFLTLTYDDDNIPAEGHLEPTALQRFIKRLRKAQPQRIRYFACGEYGEKTNRPHYHALLFNCTFTDREQVGKELYSSETLRRLWPYGDNRFGEATPAAANYIAQYNLKKQGAGDYDADGVWRPKPFLRMSLKPAIGTRWLEQYKRDLTHGYLVADGKQTAIPRTYKEKLKKLDPELAEEIEYRTYRHRIENPTNKNQKERLEAAEIIHKRQKEITEKRKI